MIQLQIIGNLTRDAEIKQSQKTNDNFLMFTVAVNTGKDTPAIFIRCIRKAYDNMQNLAQYMAKGKKVYVQGRPSIGIYNDKHNNIVRPDITCFAEHIELLSGKSDDEQTITTSNQVEEDTDLPF